MHMTMGGYTSVKTGGPQLSTSEICSNRKWKTSLILPAEEPPRVCEVREGTQNFDAKPQNDTGPIQVSVKIRIRRRGTWLDVYIISVYIFCDSLYIRECLINWYSCSSMNRSSSLLVKAARKTRPHNTHTHTHTHPLDDTHTRYTLLKKNEKISLKILVSLIYSARENKILRLWLH